MTNIQTKCANPECTTSNNNIMHLGTDRPKENVLVEVLKCLACQTTWDVNYELRDISNVRLGDKLEKPHSFENMTAFSSKVNLRK